MVEIDSARENIESHWQVEFVGMLPEIKTWLQLAFRQLGSEAREELVEEGIIHSLLSYSRLHGKGRAHVANASSLAWYAMRAVKSGRPAVGRMNAREPMSRYGRINSDIRFERQNGAWIDKLAEDKRASVVDQVAAKLDVRAWFATLTKRKNEIAKDLAFGFSTSEVAQKHGLTAGRISQLRRTLEKSWTAFQEERAPAMA